MYFLFFIIYILFRGGECLLFLFPSLEFNKKNYYKRHNWKVEVGRITIYRPLPNCHLSTIDFRQLIDKIKEIYVFSACLNLWLMLFSHERGQWRIEICDTLLKFISLNLIQAFKINHISKFNDEYTLLNFKIYKSQSII